MSEKRGLPIAAHLATLVALAFAAAFVVNLAVVIWLPPRPPDVMRGDHLIEEFQRGYAEVRDTQRMPQGTQMRWRIRTEPTRGEPTPVAHMLAPQLALRLGVPVERVSVAAHAEQRDVFVYRVREVAPPPPGTPAPHPPHGEGDVVMRYEHRVTIESSTVSGTPAPPTPPPVRRGDAPAPRAPHAPPAPSEAPEPFEIPLPPTPPDAPTPPLFAPPPPGVVLLTGFDIAAQLPDGRWLEMSQGSNWEELGWIGRAAIVTFATLALLSLLALIFARRLAKPIQNFAGAVEAVGVDPQHAAVAESGPRELRGAARAVNAMQARIRALVADRTQTLATVAHDMRTPLMRLRLAAENVEPDARERIAKEIGEVEALVSSFIAFARNDPAEEPRVRVDLAALLQSLTDDQAATGRVVSYEGEERFVVTGQSLGLKRLFSNLIDNAVKYGGAARVTLRREGEHAIVDVADDGPGVPEAEREAVFRPFVRLQASAGGAGLGLPAARSIARAHGGDIVFLDAERGALVRTTLPA